MEVKSIVLREVAPREGFQFEGIADPGRISVEDKLRLITALTETGVRTVEVTSFVSPKAVPQMADAEEVSRRLPDVHGVSYEAIFLNDKGLERALATGRYDIKGRITTTASETFALKNQRRTHEQDMEMQRKQIELYRRHSIPVTTGTMMTTFGCNYEGDIPLARVLGLIQEMEDLAQEAAGTSLERLELADTMGRGDPELIKRTVGAIRDRWPEKEIHLHLHDTRGTGLANVYAGIEMGVRSFDTSVGGLGGCPFAGTVAGNVATEDVLFMCERMGIETGVSLEGMVEAARIAEEIVGHPLPSKMAYVPLEEAA